MFLNDTACNLASINLMKFYNSGADQFFDYEEYAYVAAMMVLAQDIIVELA